MADLATPSAVAMFDAGADKKKPEKPDEAQHQAALAKAQKVHNDAMVKFKALKAQFDSIQPSKSKDTPAQKRKDELLTELKEIKAKQAAAKGSRAQNKEQTDRLDEQLKSRINEQKIARARVSFKNVDEIDREIERLEAGVNTGKLDLVDEKKSLDQASKLRKVRKSFAGFDEAQKSIDDLKAKIKASKESYDSSEAKAMSDRFNAIQAELNTMRAEQDSIYKNKSSIKDEKEAAYRLQQETYKALQKVKDDHYRAKQAVREYEQEAWKKMQARKKAEQEAYEKEKRRERAEKILAEAKDPAYLDEIRRAESLLYFLDPSANKAPTAPLLAPSGFAASSLRTVDAGGFKGRQVVKKTDEEESYFVGTGGKKGKKGRKTSPPTTPNTSGKFSCPPSVMEDCSAMGIDPPMSAADVPSVTEKVKAKLAHWKTDQKAQTERNIAKAQKEIERLDAEDAAEPTSAAAAPSTNGKKAATTITEAVSNEIELAKNAVADVVADLKGDSISEPKED